MHCRFSGGCQFTQDVKEREIIAFCAFLHHFLQFLKEKRSLSSFLSLLKIARLRDNEISPSPGTWGLRKTCQNMKFCFSQNTFFLILTFGIRSIRSPAKVGLVVTELLITSPVVSWRGWEIPPSTAVQLSFFA